MRTFWAIALLATITITTPAAADVAPIPGGCSPSQADDCSVEALIRPGITCEVCGVSNGDADACDAQFEGTDFDYICAGDEYAPGFYNEVWCDGEPATSGCTVAPGPMSLATAMLVVGLTGLLVASRRRR